LPDLALRKRHDTPSQPAKHRNPDQSSAREAPIQLQQIDHQIPIQARRDYLIEWLEQLSLDINRNFEQYQEAEKELTEISPKSMIDQQIRRVIETTIAPRRKIQEKRSAATLVVVLALFLINISPYSLNPFIYRYFNILGFSDQWLPETIIWTMLLGVIILTALLVFVQLLIYRSSRMQRFFQWISLRHVILIAFFIFLGLILAGGFARQVALGDQGSEIYNIGIPETVAGSSFNIAVIAASIATTGLWFRRQTAAITRRQAPGPLDASGGADSHDSATSRPPVTLVDGQAGLTGYGCRRNARRRQRQETYSVSNRLLIATPWFSSGLTVRVR
jgi:hypothetical protein